MTSFTEHQAVLEVELERIIADLSAVAVQDSATGDWVAIPDTEMIGNADQNVEADAVEEWNERQALMAQLEVRYRNIARALQKISDGTYGVCEISGQPIEAERLQANPAARTSIANMDREKELPI